MSALLSIDISPDELASSRPRYTVIDVRTPAEFAGGHIPGSYNVPLNDVPRHLIQLATVLDGPTVLVCQTNTRSRQALTNLQQHGVQEIQVLDSGVSGWEQAGLPMERTSAHTPWAMERQVRGVAGALALTGALGGLLVARPIGWLAAGIGTGLLFSALSNTCTMANLLGRLPYNQAPESPDVDSVVANLSQRSTTHRNPVRT